MGSHVVTLYDEVHRTFYLLGNINNDPEYREVRIAQDDKGHYLFLLSASGTRTIIRLKDIKIPPSVGREAEDLYKKMADHLNEEFKSMR